MSNILIDLPPDTVEVDGGVFKIYSDFATILQIFEVFQSDLEEDKKAYSALLLFYGDNIPEDVDDALNALVLFIRCNQEQNNSEDGEPVIDFLQDSNLIFSAFYQTYGIDLTKVNLHWWKFLALLDSISDNCLLSKVKEIRGTNLTDIKDTKQRDKIKELQQKVAIKHKNTVDESKRKDAMKLYYESR